MEYSDSPSARYRVHVIAQTGVQKPRIVELDGSTQTFRITPERKPGGPNPVGKSLSMQYLQRMERRPEKPTFLRLYFSKPSPVSCDLIFRDLSSINGFCTRALQINESIHDVVTSASTPMNKSSPQTPMSRSFPNMPGTPVHSSAMPPLDPTDLSRLAATTAPASDAARVSSKWQAYVAKRGFEQSSTLKNLVRTGIPSALRADAWSQLAGLADNPQVGGGGYRTLLAASHGEAYRHCTSAVDECLCVSERGADEGIDALRRILRAYCVRNPQASDFPHLAAIAAVLLPLLGEERAFWMLLHFTDTICSVPAAVEGAPIRRYHDVGAAGVRIDAAVLVELVQDKLPRVAKRLLQLRVAVLPLAQEWLCGLLVTALPLEAVWRVWDCVLVEGPKVLFRAALALLKHNEKRIVAAHSARDLSLSLQAFSHTPLDVDAFVALMFGFWVGSLPMARVQALRASVGEDALAQPVLPSVIALSSLSSPPTSPTAAASPRAASPFSPASPTAGAASPRAAETLRPRVVSVAPIAPLPITSPAPAPTPEVTAPPPSTAATGTTPCALLRARDLIPGHAPAPTARCVVVASPALLRARAKLAQAAPEELQVQPPLVTRSEHQGSAWACEESDLSDAPASRMRRTRKQRVRTPPVLPALRPVHRARVDSVIVDASTDAYFSALALPPPPTPMQAPTRAPSPSLALRSPSPLPPLPPLATGADAEADGSDGAYAGVQVSVEAVMTQEDHAASPAAAVAATQALAVDAPLPAAPRDTVALESCPPAPEPVLVPEPVAFMAMPAAALPLPPSPPSSALPPPPAEAAMDQPTDALPPPPCAAALPPPPADMALPPPPVAPLPPCTAALPPPSAPSPTLPPAALALPPPPTDLPAPPADLVLPPVVPCASVALDALPPPPADFGMDTPLSPAPVAALPPPPTDMLPADPPTSAPVATLLAPATSTVDAVTVSAEQPAIPPAPVAAPAPVPRVARGFRRPGQAAPRVDAPVAAPATTTTTDAPTSAPVSTSAVATPAPVAGISVAPASAPAAVPLPVDVSALPPPPLDDDLPPPPPTRLSICAAPTQRRVSSATPFESPSASAPWRAHRSPSVDKAPAPPLPALPPMSALPPLPAEDDEEEGEAEHDQEEDLRDVSLAARVCESDADADSDSDDFESDDEDPRSASVPRASGHKLSLHPSVPFGSPLAPVAEDAPAPPPPASPVAAAPAARAVFTQALRTLKPKQQHKAVSAPAPNPLRRQLSPALGVCEVALSWPAVQAVLAPASTASPTSTSAAALLQQVAPALAAALPSCASCGQRIDEAPLWLGGQPRHARCLRCDGACGQSLTGASGVFRHGTQLLCREDFLLATGRACVRCGKGVEEGLRLPSGACMHAACVACAVCALRPTPVELGQLASGGTPFRWDEDRFLCSTHYAAAHPLPTCARCSTPIEGTCSIVRQRRYHPHCLACALCSTHITVAARQPLSVLFSTIDPAIFFCGAHTQDNVACCGRCAEPLALFPYTGNMHDDCVGEVDAHDEESPNQTTPTARAPAPTAPPSKAASTQPAPSHKPMAPSRPPPPKVVCTGCSKAIGPVQTRITVGNDVFHEGCLSCEQCQQPLNEVFEHNGKRFCKQHYIEHTASLCSACGLPAVGRIQALRGGKNGQIKLHPECLRCVGCNEQLKSGGIARISVDMWRTVVDAWVKIGRTPRGPLYPGIYDGTGKANNDPPEERLACRSCMEALE